MKRNWLILSLLTLTGFILRVYFLRFEFVMNPDGVSYLRLAKNFATGDLSGGFDVYWSPLYPILTTIPMLFTSDIEMPGRIVSIVFSSLLTIPVFLFVRQIYGEIEDLVAAALVVFYGHYIASALNVGPDAVYYFLFAFVIYVGWKALTEQSLSQVVGLGILLGLCYLTRPEAIGYVPIFTVLLLSGWFGETKTPLKNRLFLAFILSVIFLVVTAPYLIYLREATGHWTISAKVAPHLIGGNFAEVSAFGQSQTPPNTFSGTVKTIVSTLLFNFQKQHKILPYMFPPLLIILASIGFFGGKWNKQRRSHEFYLLILFAATFAAYLLTVVELRYMISYLAILFAWTARGIFQTRDRLNENLPDFKLKKQMFGQKSLIFVMLCVGFISLYALPTAGIFRNDAQDREFLWREVKTSGLWLKKNVAPNPRVMAFAVQIAFYAEGEHIPLKAKTFEEILTVAKENRVEFIAISERTEKDLPDFKDWIDGKPTSNEVEEIYRDETRIGCKLIIYRLKQ